MIDKKLKILDFKSGKVVSTWPFSLTEWMDDWCNTFANNNSTSCVIYTGIDGAEAINQVFESQIYGPPSTNSMSEIYGPASGYNRTGTNIDLDYLSLYPYTHNITPLSATTTILTT